MDTIKAAKTALEKKIISWDFVSTISSQDKHSTAYINVGITDKKYTSKIEELLSDGKWMGFKVVIEIGPFSSFQ